MFAGLRADGDPRPVTVEQDEAGNLYVVHTQDGEVYKFVSPQSTDLIFADGFDP